MRRWSALALALAVVSCDGAPRSSMPGDIELGTSNTSGSQQLIDKMLAAPTHISWQGRRRYEAHYLSNGVARDSIYEETVTTDGTGRFQVKCEDVLEPQMSASEEALFLMAQDRRESFVFNHRDPLVRRKQLFFQNFTATDAGNVVWFLGHACADLTIASNIGGLQTWRALVDTTTGVVLSLEERDLSGVLLSRFEYLTFVVDPDTSSAVWHQAALAETPLDLAHADQDLGFTPHLPKFVPNGFSLMNVEKVVDPVAQRNWARLTYSDGWNSLVMMDGGTGGTAPIVQGPSVQADSMRYLELGPWTITEGLVAGRHVLLMGHLPLVDTQALIQSLLY